MTGPSGHIVIIGGGGFIGRALRAVLCDPAQMISIIGRGASPADLRPQERYYSVADHSYEELGRILAAQGVDVIIDLAYSSVPGTSYQDPVRDFSDNLGNVILHLDFARACRPARFIYVSSGGTVYGDPGMERSFSETDPNFPLSPYGITKMACERYVHMYHRLHGLDAIILRPSNIYGPGQRPFRGQGLVATALGLAWKGEPVQIFGSGSHIRDYLYIDDFCEGLLALVQSGRSGEIYNLGFGAGHSILALVDCVAGAVAEDGLRLNRTFQPERPFDVHYNVLDITKAAAAAGWQPRTSLAEGVARTWDWMRGYMQEAG